MEKLKENAKYALVVPTSMGVRIVPAEGQPIHSSEQFMLHITSAETNVASIASYLGLRTKVLTNFVKGSPIARMIKDNLASRHMDYEGRDVPQGGPWGYRHQFNIADSGFGARGPRVHNDRAGEVGRILSVDDFDLEVLFRDEGVAIVHMSGLIAALSPETGTFCLELAKVAKKYGSLVSFDLNYRESFWESREEELHSIFSQIASVADFLMGNEEDFQLCFNVKGPEVEGEGLGSKIDGFKEMSSRVLKLFPDVSVLVTTLREVVNVNAHLWGAIMWAEGSWHEAEPRSIVVKDRIGGGDGFMGGLLYGFLRGWPAERCIQFAWASGVLATSFLTDYAQPADEEQIWAIWEGRARVIR